METSQLTIPQEKAQELYNQCRQALKENVSAQRSAYYKDLNRIYNQLRRKKKIIDLFESVKKAGLNEDGDPRLAIAPANHKFAYFRKQSKGIGIYQINNSKGRWESLKNYVVLPEGTFPDFPFREGSTWNILRQDLKTVVPLVPPKILLMIPKNHSLKAYDILFEVEKWEIVPPRDPILVKKLTPNLYAVIASWNLTKLEQAIMRGRI